VLPGACQQALSVAPAMLLFISATLSLLYRVGFLGTSDNAAL
jgi:hypothetical protein